MNNKVFEKKDFIPLSIMAVFSIMPLFGVKIAGIAVILGIIYFFIDKIVNKIPGRESGLYLKSVPQSLKDIRIWFWVLLPLVFDVISILLSGIFVPGYLSHVIERAGSMIALDKIAILIPQLVILAFMEEVANRALFQNVLSKYLPAAWSILITSLFFAIAHAAEGSPAVVIYDLVFVFINSIIYGIVFHKTKNAYISTISHLISNLFGVILMFM